ncbi:hypothetical protein RB195_007901 [Necator americanus]|uniref:Uncharacterized protein n=1 Tax=Necator americanus TaxID=51031 RepID=A0ABR1C212_NECAM
MMIYTAHLLCLGLILFHCAVGENKESSDDNRTGNRQPAIGNSDPNSNPKPDAPKTLEEPPTVAPTNPTAPSVPRLPKFTVGSFFIGFCVAMLICGIVFAMIRFFMRRRAEAQPYTMY